MASKQRHEWLSHELPEEQPELIGSSILSELTMPHKPNVNFVHRRTITSGVTRLGPQDCQRFIVRETSGFRIQYGHSGIIPIRLPKAIISPLEVLNNRGAYAGHCTDVDWNRLDEHICPDDGVTNLTLAVAKRVEVEGWSLIPAWEEEIKGALDVTLSTNITADWLGEFELTKPEEHWSWREKEFFRKREFEWRERNRGFQMDIINRLFNTPGVTVLYVEPDASGFLVVSGVDDSKIESSLAYLRQLTPGGDKVQVAYRTIREMLASAGLTGRVAYAHSARGMSINTIGFRTYNSKFKEDLKWRRGAWQARARLGTFAAYSWIVVATVLAVAAGVLDKESHWIDRILKTTQVLIMLTISVFGLVKLLVHDDAVLFRLATGRRALRSYYDYATYMTGYSDKKEAVAELSRESSADWIIGGNKTSYLRGEVNEGNLESEYLDGRYLSRAYYARVGPIIFDLIDCGIAAVIQTGNSSAIVFRPEGATGDEAAKISAVNIIAMAISTRIDNHAGSPVFTRKFKYYG